jgi:hypothetical protein
MIRMSGLDKDIAKVVHQAGDDAVILANESDDVVAVGSFGSASVYGGYRSAFGTSSAIVAPMKKHNVRFVVVKYLPDDTPGPAPAPPMTAPVPVEPQVAAEPQSMPSPTPAPVQQETLQWYAIPDGAAN